MQERERASRSTTGKQAINQGMNVVSSENAPESDGVVDSLFGPLKIGTDSEKSVVKASKSSTGHIGVKWNELFAVCTNQMITKNDIELRKLIGTWNTDESACCQLQKSCNFRMYLDHLYDFASHYTGELVDQRIIKAHGDGQAMVVSLLLSSEEVDGALKYFEGKK